MENNQMRIESEIKVITGQARAVGYQAALLDVIDFMAINPQATYMEIAGELHILNETNKIKMGLLL
jgi:hypothetical protein